MPFAEPSLKRLLKLSAALLAIVGTVNGCASLKFLGGSQVSVSVNPVSATTQLGASQAFKATVANTMDTAVTWQVNSVTGGNATYGMISSTGLYTAPASMPSSGSVTVSAISVAYPTKSATATVTVVSPVAAPNVALTANPTTIAAGSGSTLAWSSTNATSCAASGGWTGTEATSGAFTVSPTTTTTYTLTCTGSGGSGSASATVTVSATPAPTVSLSASPVTIASGSSSTLTWSSTNATSCTASGGWSGSEATSGTFTVRPTSTTTYTLTCDGAGGKSSPASATVIVTAAAPTVTLTASPTTITAGGNSTLTWSSTNANSCTASGGWTGTEAASGTLTVSPATTTTYTLTCTGAGGTSTPANATIMVSSGSSGGPGTPTNLQLINQGGPNNSSAPLTNYQQIRWVAAAQGAYPISHYQIYRNGVAYDTTTNTSYTDSNAPGSNDPTWTTPAKTYAYQVAAVDTQGNIGPQAAQMSVYSYQNGESNWGNSDLSWGTLNENYASTAGNPQGGPTDVSVDFISGGFQPTANTPQSPQWDLEIGAFNYFTIDVNPGPTTAYVLNLGAVSRVPPGDVYGWHPAVNVFDYGPAPVANTWASYKIPLTDLGMGTCQFTGSISGTTLTVTRITSGPPLVDNAGFVTGPGVPAGTYIISSAQNSAVGAFTVAGPGISSSTSVPTTTMAYQRTSLYKFAVFPSVEPTQMYFNNMGWTTSASATSPAPTATLSASPTTVASGASSNLSWSSTNATSCAASGGWTGTEATSGTFTVSPTNTTTYTLTCTGAGGTSAPANVTVTVAPAPTVTLTAIPTSITSGSNSTLTWSSKNATSCAASGGWTGTEATNGTQSVSPIATTTYSLTCTGEGGTTSPASATVTVTSASPGLTKVGTGEYEIYYLIDGTIYGYGSPGLLGLGNNPTEIAIPPAPIATPSGLKFIDVQGGMHQSLALDQNGHVWTWGDAADGRAGDGQNHASLVNTTPYMITQDNQGNDFGDVIAVYASYVFDAAIKSDGTVWVWGDCTAADTGDGTTGAIVTSPTRVPLSLPGGVKITQLGVGDGIFALASDGTVWAWGQSENVDDLGTGNPDYENPHQVAGLPSNIKQIAWGAGHYALTTDGELYGWGYRGAYLGIGDGVNTWQPTPTAISLTTILELPAPVAFVVSSSLTTHVILTDGSLWGWGSAGNGGIGDGQEPDWATANPPYAWDWGAYDMMVMKPVRIVPSVSNFKAIFANSTYDFYIYALTTDGKLFSWGRNKTGVLGNGVYPMAANGNFGTASNIAATYPNSWDVSTATEVTPMTTKGIPTNSPYCVANPNAADCF